jgi:hypothetical protein
MTLKSEQGIFWIHAAAVVGDTNVSTLGADGDFNLCGARVDAVFNQLFDDRGWSFDYFSGGNLAGDVIW